MKNKKKKIIITVVIIFFVVIGLLGYITLEIGYQNLQKTKFSCRSMAAELDSILGSKSESYSKIWSAMGEIESGKKKVSEFTGLAEQESQKMKELVIKYDSLMDSKHIDCFGFPAKSKKE